MEIREKQKIVNKNYFFEKRKIDIKLRKNRRIKIKI